MHVTPNCLKARLRVCTWPFSGRASYTPRGEEGRRRHRQLIETDQDRQLPGPGRPYNMIVKPDSCAIRNKSKITCKHRLQSYMTW